MKNIRKYCIFAILLLVLAAACTPTVEAPVPTVSPSPTQTSSPTEIPPTPTATLMSGPPTSVPSRPLTVLIYLVAIGDNGASGSLIGCGDSLVGVEIAVEPSQAVLRNALTELFNLSPEMTFGQSGLYNALYLSDLQIASVEVVESEAIIRLTGSLVYGGECDIPRIEAQLTQIALQFDTIDSVSIYVNDTPLAELLDLRG